MLGRCNLIFVTVGTQLPFNRLTRILDSWSSVNPTVRIESQLGLNAENPSSLNGIAMMPASLVREKIAAAEVIVAHAGMGTILSCLELRKPIIIFPRLASLGEHRNEHQSATARWLDGRPGVYVAWDEASLVDLLNQRKLLCASTASLSNQASPELIGKVQLFFSSHVS